MTYEVDQELSYLAGEAGTAKGFGQFRRDLRQKPRSARRWLGAVTVGVLVFLRCWPGLTVRELESFPAWRLISWSCRWLRLLVRPSPGKKRKVGGRGMEHKHLHARGWGISASWC